MKDAIWEFIKIIAKYFPYMKFELEANFLNDGDEFDYDEITEHIIEVLPRDITKHITFGQAYDDSSVNMEYTFTIATEAIRYVPDVIKAFTDCAPDGYNTKNAGFHIAVLTDKNGVYPCDSVLDREKLENFISNVQVLLPAMLYASANKGVTRSLYYRELKISSEKYSAIHIVRGGLEYRIFEPCLDNPEKVFDYIKIIANTLKYYSKRKITSKLEYKMEFPGRLREPSNTATSIDSLFQDINNLTILRKTMPYVDKDLPIRIKLPTGAKLIRLQNRDLIKAMSKYQHHLLDIQESIKVRIKRDYLDHLEYQKQAVRLADLAKITAQEYVDIQNNKKYKPESVESRDFANNKQLYKQVADYYKLRITGRTLEDFTTSTRKIRFTTERSI